MSMDDCLDSCEIDRYMLKLSLLGENIDNVSLEYFYVNLFNSLKYQLKL